jgi:hypothetical protein
MIGRTVPLTLAIGLILAFALSVVSTPVRAPRAYAGAILAAPAGQADMAVVSQGGVAPVTGTMLEVVVRVEPNNVQVDAAAAYLTYNSQYLELAAISPGDTNDTEIHRSTDTPGTVYYASGRLASPWPTTAFTLARFTFRLKSTPPTSLSFDLVPRSESNPFLTDIASAGLSVLAVTRSGTVTFATPTVPATAVPATAVPATAVPATAVPTQTAVPAAPTTAPAPAATQVPDSPAAPIGGGGASGSSGGGGGSGSGGGGGSVTVPPAPAPVPAAPAAPATGGSPVGVGLTRGAIPPLPPGLQIGVHAVAPPFAQFYAERQGLRLLGNTLAPPASEGGFIVQYFEKGRIEEHPAEANPAWRFQYGLLVDELAAAQAGIPVGGDASTLTYASIHGLSQLQLRVAPPEGFVGGTMTLSDGSVFIPFSAELRPGPGQVVPTVFWWYINDESLFPGGWLHDVGLPTTAPVEAVVDKGPDKDRRILVQAFQRAILTYDPLNPDGWQVERANVGTDYARIFPEKFSPLP